MTTPAKPFEEQDILEKLKLRAEIRRNIGRKADGKPDRIADTCDEAYALIVRQRATIVDLEDENRELRLRIFKRDNPPGSR